MDKRIKKLLKATPAYSISRNRKLRKDYAQKYDLSLDEIKKCHIINATNQNKILANARIKNIAYGDFFYTLDTSIIIDRRNRMIDNMPVDYGYVLNNCINEVPIFVREYIERIGDPRVKLVIPQTLKEALQLILFWNSLLWQTGHTLVGLGRLDKVLETYPVPTDAEELICDFLNTLHCEYKFKSATLMGDTGQIILLGGLNEDGSYFSNEYTYLFIKCLKDLHLPDPKILLRCSKNMPRDLIEVAVDCASTGIGSPLFSNDDVIIPDLIEFGYENKDAFNYGVSACWEPLSIGNALEQNNLANITYGKYVDDMLSDDEFIKCMSFEDVLSLYEKKLSIGCEIVKKRLNNFEWNKDELLSFMMGLKRDISTGSAKYNNYGILSVGMSSAVNSLLNINKYVFKEKIYSLSDLKMKAETDDVREFEENKSGFGTDTTEVINLTNYLIKKTETYFRDYRNIFGGKVKFGLSSPSYIDNGKLVGATLDGRKAGQPFQTHISRDKGEPITEIMNFESKLKFSGVSCNANVIDVMVQASLIKDNIDKFTSYIMGGIAEGIFQLQMNVLSYAQLVDAKAHPEKYPNLIVRVWGFSAYFNDLPEEYKDNLIKRAKEMEHVA